VHSLCRSREQSRTSAEASHSVDCSAEHKKVSKESTVRLELGNVFN
jgi:hypothetical protein